MESLGCDLSDRIFQRIAETGKLYPAVSHGQIQPAADGTGQKNIKPGNGVERAGKEGYDLVKNVHIIHSLEDNNKILQAFK